MRETILEAVVEHFVSSAERNGFNGIRANILTGLVSDAPALRAILRQLVEDQQVSAVFSCAETNMHIKRSPDLPVEKQLCLLETVQLEDFCLYPSTTEMLQRTESSKWLDRPFSRRLLLAEPQLDHVTFDLPVIERYRNDPRYRVDFEDYMGRMDILDEYYLSRKHLDKDKVSLRSFGLGFDDQGNTFIIAILRYLSLLSSEHQMYWQSFMRNIKTCMSKQYSIYVFGGDFWKNRSVRYAIVKEMELINVMAQDIWGKNLFRKIPDQNVPIGLTSFLLPTAENFDRFVLALDKCLSENINTKFFKDKVPIEVERSRPDGKVEVQRRGSIALLEDWLETTFIWQDSKYLKERVIEPFRNVRKLRQSPAHKFVPNTLDVEFGVRRRNIIAQVYCSLRSIRKILVDCGAASIEVPGWLDSDDIDLL